MWRCTPRELAGRLMFSSVVERKRRAITIGDQAMAARGEARTLKKTLKELARE